MTSGCRSGHAARRSASGTAAALPLESPGGQPVYPRVRWLWLTASVGLTVAVPVLFTDTTPEADSLKTVVVYLGVATLTLAWLAQTVASGSVRLPSRLVLAAGAAFVGAYAISWLLGEHRPGALWALWRVVLLALLGLVAAATLADAAARRWLGHALCAGGLAVGSYALLQRLGCEPIPWSAESRSRVFSFIGNPNMLAGYCVVVSPVLLLLTFAPSRWPRRVAYGGATVLLCLALVFTMSKGGVLGAAAAGLALAVVYRRVLFGTPRARLATVTCAVALIVILLLLGAPLWRRFGELGGLGQRQVSSANVRLVIWRGALRMFAAHPLLGVGPGNFRVFFPRYRSPDYETYGVTHNTLNAESELLETMAELGLLGTLAWVGLLGAVGWSGLRVWRALPPGSERLLLAGALCGLLGLVVHNLVCVNLRWITSGFFCWLFLGLAAGYSSRRVSCGRGRWRWAFWLVAVVAAVALVAGAKYLSWDWYRSEQLTMTGMTATTRGQWPKTVDALARAVALNAANTRARYYLAHAYCQLGAYDRAAAEYRELQEWAPDYAQVHYNLAAAYLSLGRWLDAATEFAVQRRIGGLPGTLPFEALLETLRAQGRQDDKYVGALERLLAINPRDLTANTMLGNYRFEHGDYPAARRHYLAILAAEPRHVPALNNLAGVSFVQKDYATARDACLTVLAVDPGAAAVWRNLGKAHFMLGDSAAARRAWRRAEELEPGREDVRDFLRLAPL